MMQKDTLSVSEFVYKIKNVVNDEPQFQNVAIVGELSNFTAHGSGHFYFSIKDDKASMRAVMFRSNSFKVKFKPKDGDKVVVIGSLDLYPQSGQIQMVIRQMNLDGLGDLYIEFEKLKKELSEKGFFDESHKKKIPEYPKNIGIITGENTAAHADMKRTAQERWPYATIHYFHSLVQGEFAKDDLIKQVKNADAKGLDVIIMARGGGSIEDLWPFNELELVIEVFNSKTPIISGIGHESDTTLVDYVSDYRAATPTAAVVVATPDAKEIKESLRNTKNNMYRSTVTKLNDQKRELEAIQNTRTFKNPNTLFDTHYMTLDLLNSKLISRTNLFHQTQKEIERLNQGYYENLNRKFFVYHHELKMIDKDHITMIQNLIQRKKQAYLDLEPKLIQHLDLKLNDSKQALIQLFNKFDLLSPFKIMKRGYGILSKNDRVIKTIQDVKENEVIDIRLEDGFIEAQVLKIKGEQEHD